jgi:hypothetical protein
MSRRSAEHLGAHLLLLGPGPFDLGLHLGVDVEVNLTPRCILYGELLMKCTGWRQHDFNVQGWLHEPKLLRDGLVAVGAC